MASGRRRGASKRQVPDAERVTNKQFVRIHSPGDGSPRGALHRVIDLRPGANPPAGKAPVVAFNQPAELLLKGMRHEQRKALIEEFFAAAERLTEAEFRLLIKEAKRLPFERGRAPGVDHVENVLGDPELSPPKYVNRKPSDDVFSFLRREYGDRGLLKGYLTRARLRLYDATLVDVLYNAIRSTPLPPDINIPPASRGPKARR